MPTAKSHRNPKIGRHASGQAYVQLSGHRHYLGRYDDPGAHEKGHRLISEWLANGRRIKVEPRAVTVTEIIAAYIAHAESVYRRPDGTPSKIGTSNILLALAVPKQYYGSARAVDFGPLALRACLNHWIAAGLRRTTCNKRLGDLKRAFKWAASMELIPVSTYQALLTVEGLRHGRCTAKESRVVTAVAEAHVFAIQDHVARPVWGLVQLQWYTGARSGEILKLRRCDIDCAGEIWSARIAQHKTALRGKARILYFGHNAQAVLREFFVGKSPFEFLFSPKDAEAERRAEMHAQRTTPLSCGNRPGTNRKETPAVSPGGHYTSDSYRKAVTRACKSAGVPEWHPHQLRHSAATRIEKEFGLAAAACWLGH